MKADNSLSADRHSVKRKCSDEREEKNEVAQSTIGRKRERRKRVLLESESAFSADDSFTIMVNLKRSGENVNREWDG